MGKHTIRFKRSEQRGILTLLNTKGKKRGKPGQPKFPHDLKVAIIVKIKKYKKDFKLTPYKAWIKLSQEKALEELLELHYSKRSGGYKWWIANLDNKMDTDSTTPRQNFYKNHIKKWISK